MIEQPTDGLGAINDMWFSWVTDVGKPGPDRGLGGKYLIVGPGYDGPLPESGYFTAHSKTNKILYAASLPPSASRMARSSSRTTG